MTGNKFTEQDSKRYVEALNYIAQNARFTDVDTVKNCIELYKHFSFLQSLVAKIDDNILEVRKVHVPTTELQSEPEIKPAVKKGKK